MRRAFSFEAFGPDLAILAEHSPQTAALRDLLVTADYVGTLTGRVDRELREKLREPVVAATDPWSDVLYQSLYLTGDDPEDRLVLLEPPVRDPATGVVVLKAARLRGESGLVFCGPTAQLDRFKSKLAEYEKRGIDLDEKEFLRCLSEAAAADGLRVVYEKLSPEHGGEEG